MKLCLCWRAEVLCRLWSLLTGDIHAVGNGACPTWDELRWWSRKGHEVLHGLMGVLPSHLPLNTRDAHLWLSSILLACRIIQILIILKETSHFQAHLCTAVPFQQRLYVLNRSDPSPKFRPASANRLEKHHPDYCYSLLQRMFRTKSMWICDTES